MSETGKARNRLSGAIGKPWTGRGQAASYGAWLGAVLSLAVSACDPATHTVGVVMPASDSAGPGPTETIASDPNAEAPAAAGPTGSAFGDEVAGSGDGRPRGMAPVKTPNDSTAGTGGMEQPATDADGQSALIDVDLQVPTTPDTTTPDTTTQGTPATVCDEAIPAVPRRLELYLLVDRVFSFPGSSSFDLIEQGLRQFIRSPQAADASAAMLAVRSLCDAEQYSAPDVPWGLAPDSAESIERELRELNIAVAQPEAAMEAAITHARERAQQYPQRSQALVLLSDGFDLGVCIDSTRETTEATVATGPNGDPAVPMYVIALGTSNFNPLDLIPGTLSLPGLAEAGGTGEARVADISEGAGAVVEALNDVRLTAQPCEYEVPTDIDAPMLQLAGDEPLPRVDDASRCDRTDGGFYAGQDDQAGFLVACPATCSRIQELGHDQVVVVPSDCM